MTFQRLEEEMHFDWDRFAIHQENGSLFQTTWWYRAWGLSPTVMARRNAQGEIEAGQILNTERFMGLRTVRRPPYTPVNGPVYIGGGKSRYARQTEVKKELSEAIAAMPEVDFYDIVLAPGARDIMPFLWTGFEPHVLYTYVLPRSEREAWRDGLSQMIRRNLKKAHKEATESGCTIGIDPPIRKLEPLVRQTAQTKGFSLRQYTPRIADWWSAVSDREAGRAYAVHDSSGAPLCATLMVWDETTAYYVAGGMTDMARESSHLNLLLFERMIEDAHGQDLDFDFEGSVVPGVEGFFRGWGGELRTRYRLTKARSTRARLQWAAYRLVNLLRR